MKRIALAAALLALIIPASAQTLLPPTAASPTVVCLTVSTQSTLAPGLSATAACFGLTDAVLAQLFTAYAPPCANSNRAGEPPSLPIACTAPQIIAFVVNDVQDHVLSFVAQAARAAAAAAASAAVTVPTVTPLQ